MSNYEKEVNIIQTLPTEFPSADDDESSLHKFYYDTFAFRDRITNHRFQYKEAREKQEPKLSFLDWVANESIVNSELKNSLNVYKFTKNF
jgi:hypothetical protein